MAAGLDGTYTLGVANLGEILTLPSPAAGLTLESVSCCVCGCRDAAPIGVGEDFEYRTSRDSFLAVRCNRCGLVYLDPRPAPSQMSVIYPDSYHAFSFDDSSFGLAFRVRRRLEARRMLRAARGLPADARILDVGCGDGFHLDLLRDYGRAGWRLEGVDTDARAVRRATQRGLSAHLGTLAESPVAAESVDLALCIQTIEHVTDPPQLLADVYRVLRPGGRLLLVTDNTGSLDFAMSKSRHWGGYHFPRHFNLFHRPSLTRLARNAGFEIAQLTTMVSPVNWTYSVRNLLDDWGAPRWCVERFSLASPVALGVFTVFDVLHRAVGRGALLRALLRRPA